jgi:UDP-N-acetylglucosamine 2-epimerase (non-hydrolysing)
MGIPIYHLEAGNRSFDSNVPEEVNRKIIDHTADFNLAYSRHAESNLLREGLSSRHCMVMGTPLREVIHANRSRIDESQVLVKLKLDSNNYFLVSSHRQENIDSPVRLAELIRTLNLIAETYQIPVVVTTHPRLKSMMAMGNFISHQLVKFIEPTGFIDYCKLQLNSRVVLSDSGSVSEESALLNFKAITLRDSMERPEALEAGTILMSGLNADRTISAIEFLQSNVAEIVVPEDYLITNSSDRVLNFIQSTFHVRDFWSGRR